MQASTQTVQMSSAESVHHSAKKKIFRTLPRETKVWLLSIFLDWLVVAVVFVYCYLHMAKASTWFGHCSVGIWVIVSIASGKLKFNSIRNVKSAVFILLVVNVIIMVLIYFCCQVIHIKIYFVWNWFLVFFVVTLVELIGYSLYWTFRKTDDYIYEPVLDEKISLNEEPQVNEATFEERIERIKQLYEILQKDPIRNKQWMDAHQKDLPQGVEVVYDNGRQERNDCRGNIYFNSCRLNDIRHVNSYFTRLNGQSRKGDTFVFRVMVHSLRKSRVLSIFPFPLNYMLYFVDYLCNRVLPKMLISRTVYFWLTNGRHIVFPHAEILGRLYSCGFEVLGEELINDELYIVAYNSREPYKNVPSHYGMVIRLARVGKDGVPINVYKFRTMSAYAEYLQPFMYEKYHLKSGGKFNNDFRINTFGRKIRKSWLDELPMIINWIEGDMKLIGVRPLSKQYFNLYDKDLQELRIKSKPGLIPPFYADMPETLAEIEASERRYLEAYFKRPGKTDWIYFWKIVKNIIFKHKRSS